MKKKLVRTWNTLKELGKLEAGDEETQKVLENRILLLLTGNYYGLADERSKESRRKYSIVLSVEETDRLGSKKVIEKIREKVMMWKNYGTLTKPNVRGYERKGGKNG